MSGELVVASFNVHWGRGRRSDGYPPFDVVAASRRLDADVLVLQETLAPDEGLAQHDAVADELGYKVVDTVAMARMSLADPPKLEARGGDPAGGGEGSWNLAVLSRIPVLGVETHRLPQLPPDPVTRHVIEATLDVGGTAVTLCGVHLPHLEFGAPLIRNRLRAALPGPEAPAVLAGDMNMWGWTIAAMTPRHWRRALRGRTFPAPTPWFGIDHVLVNPRVEVRHGEVVPVTGSDHFPVRAVLRVG